MMDREHKVLKQLSNHLESVGSPECISEIHEISYGVYRIGEFSITPHNCPICLRNEGFSDDLCQECDWFVPQVCPFSNNHSARRYIRRIFKIICEQEYLSWCEAQAIRDAARKFLATSPRPRHHAVIAYEVRQEYPNIKSGNMKVLHVLREYPKDFVEVKTDEFRLA